MLMKVNLRIGMLITVGMLSLCISACSLRPMEEEALKPPLIKPVKENFEVYEVKRGTLTKLVTGSASVVPSKMENLFFKESGARLQSMNVSLGAEIKVGDVVAQLETGDLDSRIRLQQLNLEKAKIALDQVKQDQLGNISAVRLKMIDVEAAQIQLDLLLQQLQRTKLVSGIAGIVTYLDPIKSGETVTSFKSIITVSDPNQVQLLYENGNSSELTGVNVGMDVKVKISSDKEVVGTMLQTPATAPFTDNKAQADKNAKTFIIGIDNLQQLAKIGSSLPIVIETERSENVLVIPRVGLRSYLGRDYVQILDGESRKEIDVEKGLQTGTEVEIRKGLKEGQKVIISN
ncbi:MAG: transporter [Paenibacillus sp.]|nr:transporter [Paenibacillus sp.]